MRALLAIIVALTLTSCDFAFEPKVQEDGICRTNSECASGLTCRQGNYSGLSYCRSG